MCGKLIQSEDLTRGRRNTIKKMSLLRTIVLVVSFCHVVVVGGATGYELDVNVIDQPSEILTAECCRSESYGLVSMSLVKIPDGGKPRRLLARVSCGEPHCVEVMGSVAAFGYKSSDQNPSMLTIALEPSLSSDIHDQQLLCHYHVTQLETEPALVRRRPARKLRVKVDKPQAEIKTNFTLLMDLQDSQRRWNPVFGEKQGPTGNESSSMVYDPEEGILRKMVNNPVFSEVTLLISNDSQFYSDTQWRCQMKGEESSVRIWRKKRFYIPCKGQKDEECVGNDNTNVLVIIGVVIVIVVLAIVLCVIVLVKCFYCTCRKRKKKAMARSPGEDDKTPTPVEEEGKEDILLQYRDYNGSL